MWENQLYDSWKLSLSCFLAKENHHIQVHRHFIFFIFEYRLDKVRRLTFMFSQLKQIDKVQPGDAFFKLLVCN